MTDGEPPGAVRGPAARAPELPKLRPAPKREGPRWRWPLRGVVRALTTLARPRWPLPATNPDIRERVYYDWDAIELAMQERISGTGIPTRGIGLYAISDDMRKPGHHLLIHSGIGLVSQSEELEADARRTTLFPGTLAYATIPA